MKIRIISVPNSRNAAHWHQTGGPLYPFSFGPLPAVRFAEGGEKWGREKALERATQVYSNYEDVIDLAIPRWRLPIQKAAFMIGMPSKLSNCTLSATQWVDPNNPIMSAKHIVKEPKKYGYIPIKAEDAIPGDLIIASNPQGNAFHSMYIEGFDENNKPIVRYSKGVGTPESLVQGISVNEYHRRDNGKHTKDLYYRYVQNGIPLQEVIVTPNQKSTGGPMYPFSFSKQPLPPVRH